MVIDGNGIEFAQQGDPRGNKADADVKWMVRFCTDQMSSVNVDEFDREGGEGQKTERYAAIQFNVNSALTGPQQSTRKAATGSTWQEGELRSKCQKRTLGDVSCKPTEPLSFSGLTSDAAQPQTAGDATKFPLARLSGDYSPREYGRMLLVFGTGFGTGKAIKWIPMLYFLGGEMVWETLNTNAVSTS